MRGNVGKAGGGLEVPLGNKMTNGKYWKDDWVGVQLQNMIYKYKTKLGYMYSTNLSLSCETERRSAVWRHDRVGVEVPESFQGVEVPENCKLSFLGFLPKRLRQCFEVQVIGLGHLRWLERVHHPHHVPEDDHHQHHADHVPDHHTNIVLIIIID